MSEIKGKVKESEKLVGWDEVKVLAINPSREELNELLGIEGKEDATEINYIDQSQDQNDRIRIDVWVQNVKRPAKKDKITFFLEDKDVMRKDGTKSQYINSVGTTSWAEDKNELPSWFVKYEFRKAKKGEEAFYNFVRSWLGKLDYRNDATDILQPFSEVIKGKLNDLRKQINGAYSVNFYALYTVRTDYKSEEMKQYQSIYNGAFLSKLAIRQFRLIDYDNEKVLADILNKTEKKTYVENIVVKIKGEQGGCKDSFILKDAKAYNPDDFLVATNATLSTDDAEY